jgi:hypothetical protein
MPYWGLSIRLLVDCTEEDREKGVDDKTPPVTAAINWATWRETCLTLPAEEASIEAIGLAEKGVKNSAVSRSCTRCS